MISTSTWAHAIAWRTIGSSALAEGSRARPHVVERDALQDLLLEREARTALVGERRHRDLPAAVDRADDVRRRDGDVLEEHLAELGRARDLRERPDGDAGALHVEDEVGEPLVLRRLWIGARQQDGPLRELRVARPDLLPGHAEDVAVALGLGAHGGEIAAGARLAEELTPHLVPGEDGREEAVLLRLGAVRDQRRAGVVDADAVQQLGRAGGAPAPRSGSPAARAGRSVRRTRAARGAPRSPRRRAVRCQAFRNWNSSASEASSCGTRSARDGLCAASHARSAARKRASSGESREVHAGRLARPDRRCHHGSTAGPSLCYRPRHGRLPRRLRSGARPAHPLATGARRARPRVHAVRAPAQPRRAAARAHEARRRRRARTSRSRSGWGRARSTPSACSA